MAKQINLVLFTLMLTFAAGSVFGQGGWKTETMTVSPDEATIIPGLAALVRMKDSALVVEMVPEPDHRPEKFKNVDIKTGDKVLMCNGRRVTSCVELRNIIDSVSVGGEVKLGLRRGSAMLIATLEKVDAPAGEVMISTQGGPGQKVVEFGDGGGNVEGTVLVLDGGIIIGKGDPDPVVIAVMPDAATRLEGDQPKEGDVIVSINDNLDTNIAAFEEWYTSVPDGRKITVVFSRDGEQMQCTYTKAPMKSGRMMITK